MTVRASISRPSTWVAIAAAYRNPPLGADIEHTIQGFMQGRAPRFVLSNRLSGISNSKFGRQHPAWSRRWD